MHIAHIYIFLGAQRRLGVDERVAHELGRVAHLVRGRARLGLGLG